VIMLGDCEGRCDSPPHFSFPNVGHLLPVPCYPRRLVATIEEQELNHQIYYGEAILEP